MSTLEQINQAVSKIPLKKIGSCIGTPERLENIPWKKIGIATAVAVPSVYVGAPFFISTLGFKAGGIAAGSVAAKWMSMVAVANGGGIPATSIVAAMQSAGVLGISTKTGIIIGSAVSGAVCLAPSTDNIHVAEDTSSKTVIEDSDNKSVVNGGTSSALLSACNMTSDVITRAASSTYSTVKSAGHATYGLIDKGSSVLLFPFTNQSAETKDDASGKTVTEGARYQTVVDGASSTVKGTASIISRVVKMPVTLWSSVEISDVKKEE